MEGQPIEPALYLVGGLSEHQPRAGALCVRKGQLEVLEHDKRRFGWCDRRRGGAYERPGRRSAVHDHRAVATVSRRHGRPISRANGCAEKGGEGARHEERKTGGGRRSVSTYSESPTRKRTKRATWMFSPVFALACATSWEMDRFGSRTEG